MYKISKQREWIYTYMKEHPGQHFSAEDIFAGLNEMGKNISLATVYRNLKILQSEHRIASLMLASGKQVFDQTCRPHDHLICTHCHRVFDVDMPYDRSLERKAENHLQLPVESHSLILYGICTDCLKER